MDRDIYKMGNSVWVHASVPWQQDIITSYLRSIHPKEWASVIDLGTGIGNNLKSLEKIVRGVTVVDVSEFALSRLKESYKNKFKRLNIIQEDLNTVKFLECSFDIVLMTEVIEHLENPEVILKKIMKILKPGGYLIISIPNYLNVAGIWKKVAEKLFKKTWDAWGNHEEGIENFMTVPKLKRWLRQESFIPLKERGGDVIRSWFPFLRKQYNFIDRHPMMVFGKIWPIKYFLMNYFILCQKPNSPQ